MPVVLGFVVHRQVTEVEPVGRTLTVIMSETRPSGVDRDEGGFATLRA
jgi:hypothetical protein